MSSKTGMLAVAAIFLIAGCATTAPSSDTTNPEVTVIVSEGRGGNIFRSRDGELPPTQSCINVPEPPRQLILIAGDSGGVRSASIKVFPGTIDPDSVEVTPAAPEGTFAIRTERGADTLVITLTRTAPDVVRTGATAIIEVEGDLPMAITGHAEDWAGNVAVLPQFDLRSPDDAVVCRGEQ